MNDNIKMLIVAAIMLLVGNSAIAQNKRNRVYELHVGAVASNVFGDVGGGLGKFQLSQTRPALYLGGRYDFNDYFSAKANLFAGRTSGNDAGTKNDLRGYSFTATTYELSAQLEWNIVRLNWSLGSLSAKKRGVTAYGMQTRPYIFAGVGFVFTEPVLAFAQPNGRLPEGASSKESAIGLAVPAGIGIRTDLSRYWALGLEIGARFCTSDYLDGLALPKSNDFYCFTSIHVAYKLRYLNGKLEKKR
ncbi:MAG: DUF6089 family protein [Bacteroidales bacterium]|nr:DUF6089 family protein [Bacteroidales bacterium]